MNLCDKKWLIAVLVLVVTAPLHGQVTLENPLWKVEAGTLSWFGTNNTERGGDYNPVSDHVLVVSRAVSPRVVVVDAETGDSLNVLDIFNVAGGTFPINEIGVTRDGQIFAANLTVDASSSASKIYRWADETDSARVVFEATFDAGGRYGDSFGVDGTNGLVNVYLSGTGNDKLASFGWTGSPPLTNPDFLAITSGLARGGIAEIVGEDSVWVNGFGTPTTKINTFDGSAGSVISGSVLPAATMDVDHFELDGRMFVAAGPTSAQTFMVVDVTDPANPVLVAETESLGNNSNGNQTGFVAFDATRRNLIVCATNNSIASYALDTLATAVHDDLSPVMPAAIRLHGSYPNPFWSGATSRAAGNPGTVIRFDLPATADVELTVFDATGRTVAVVKAGMMPAGIEREIAFDASQLTSGAYFYKLTATSKHGVSAARGRMTVLK